MDIRDGRKLYVLVSKFGRTRIKLTKNMLTILATDPTRHDGKCRKRRHKMVRLEDSDLSKGQEVVTDVNDKPAEDRSSQMKRRDKVMNEDAKRQEKNWRDNVGIGYTYGNISKEITTMLSELTSMWNGHLGTIRKVKHRIYLETPEDKIDH